MQKSLQVVLAFVNGLQLNFGLTSDNILRALQEAHRAADEYYTIRHAMEWDTMFVIPAEVIAADQVYSETASMIFPKCVGQSKTSWFPTAYQWRAS